LFFITSLEDIITSQYKISKYSNIGIDVSSCLPYFEFEILIDLLIEDIKRETEELNS
jgi:hypothetical protein